MCILSIPPLLLYVLAEMGGRFCFEVLHAVCEDFQLFQPKTSLQALWRAVLRPLLHQAVATGPSSVRCTEALLAHLAHLARKRGRSHSCYH